MLLPIDTVHRDMLERLGLRMAEIGLLAREAYPNLPANWHVIRAEYVGQTLSIRRRMGDDPIVVELPCALEADSPEDLKLTPDEVLEILSEDDDTLERLAESAVDKAGSLFPWLYAVAG